MFRMIVFDMAGTTVNEDNVVYKTLLTAINAAGFPVSLEQVLAVGAGMEKLQAIKSILARYTRNESEATADEIFARFQRLLKLAYTDLEVLPQRNATALFAGLRAKNMLVVLNTGYDRATAESLLQKLQWKLGTAIDGLVTATDVKNNRPDPDMILLAMKQFGITDPKQVIKVGDSAIDIEEGKNAGCGMTIGITTGAHTVDQLAAAHPDHIIDDLMEINKLLETPAPISPAHNF